MESAVRAENRLRIRTPGASRAPRANPSVPLRLYARPARVGTERRRLTRTTRAKRGSKGSRMYANWALTGSSSERSRVRDSAGSPLSAAPMPSDDIRRVSADSTASSHTLSRIPAGSPALRGSPGRSSPYAAIAPAKPATTIGVHAHFMLAFRHATGAGEIGGVRNAGGTSPDRGRNYTARVEAGGRRW